MPRKLSTNKVYQDFVRYGFIPKTNFYHINVDTKHKLWSEIDQKPIKLSYSQLKRMIKSGKAVEYAESLNQFMNSAFDEQFGSLRTDLFKHSVPKSSTSKQFEHLMQTQLSNQSEKQRDQLDRFISSDQSLIDSKKYGYNPDYI